MLKKRKAQIYLHSQILQIPNDSLEKCTFFQTLSVMGIPIAASLATTSDQPKDRISIDRNG
jgi:hypothetical protein